jgi:ferredoxin
MLYIHPDECVDCGACEPVCPVEAIYYEDDVPDKWKDFYNANVEFFSDLGSPGGAAKTARSTRTTRWWRRSRRRPKATDRRPPRGVRVPAARLPVGLPRRSPGRGRRCTPAVSSTSPSAPRSTTRRPSCRRPWPARATPGYPTALGTPELRTAAAGWLQRRLGRAAGRPAGRRPRRWSHRRLQGAGRAAADHAGLRGRGHGGHPEVAYPTYEVGAVLAGLACGAPTPRRTTPPASSWCG